MSSRGLDDADFKPMSGNWAPMSGNWARAFAAAAHITKLPFICVGFSMRSHSHRNSADAANGRPDGKSLPPRSGVSSRSLRDLRGWLESVLVGSGGQSLPKRGRLLLETLERRQMLAGDVEFLATDGYDSVATQTQSVEQSGLLVTTQPEGEAEPDLVQFAKDLAAADVLFFGAAWCPACTQQKELFQDGGRHLPFIEVTGPDRTLNGIGISEGIEQFPTWEFPDESREVGVLDLATLSARSGVPIPQGVNPTFAALGPQTVRINSPLHIPIDAYDPNGGPLTVTLSVNDPSLLEATVITGNRSLRLETVGFGEMVFELFEQRAPRPTGRVIELAESGFYDGIIFHRVVNNPAFNLVVIQAGDPTGTGTSGSDLGFFDDQFHPDLQHNRSGILSFAKTTDDTNNSQFFITGAPARHLDFNHSIFGQLVEGEDVREAINNMEVDGSGRPTTPIVINQASVFSDTENSVIMLKALGGTGQTNVTVTVTDQDGNSHSEIVQVQILQDNANSQPFLTEITPPAPVPTGTPATLQLSSIDIEGDPVRYLASLQTSGNVATVTVNETSGLVTVTPAAGFIGEVDVLVAVRALTATNDLDSQLVTFTFEAAEEILPAPTSLDLDPSSDTGASDSDNVTRAGTLVFHVGGVTEGATVEIVDTATAAVIGVGVATGSTITISTNNIAALGDGTYVLVARQRNGTQVSTLSPPLTLVYDSTPPASVLPSAPRFANVGQEYLADLISVEEGSGLVYSFITAPNGATIEASTGVIQWTPTSQQVGNNTFTLQLSDLAGNVRTESFTVVVGDEPIAGIRLELADLDGNIIDSIDAGSEFLLRMYGVDERSGSDQRGVFAAYADILFNGAIVRPVPGSTIQYANVFALTRTGTLANGLIDELGAARSSLSPSEESESLIATIRMEALTAGSVNFRSEPADAPDSEVLLYLRDEQVQPGQVAYGTVSIAVGLGFRLNDDAITIAADAGPTAIDVLANDEILSGTGPLTVVSVTQPAQGGAVAVAGGVVTFTPDASFAGTTTFTYRARNPAGAESQATVTVTVAGVGQPPIGVPDEFTVLRGSGATSLDVLANDSPAPGGGQTLTIAAVSQSSGGATITIAAGGQSINYAPPSDFTGVDTFTYTLSDGELSTEVTVAVTVTTADPPPVANPDAFTIAEDTPEAAYDVLANDQTGDSGEPFVLHSVGTPTAGGTARISEDGLQLLYAPAANFNGVEQVTYAIRDTGGGIASTTVTFTVTPVNDPPPANDRTVAITRSADEREVHRLEDLPPNVDAGETLTFTAVGNTSAGGTVRIGNGGASIFYTPPSGAFTGADTFTYTVEDDGGLTSQATLTIQVTDFTLRTIRVTAANGSSSLQHIAHAISLTGTNSLGETVNRTPTMNATGAQFEGLFPGQYTLNIPAVPFLQNGTEPRQISINSDPQDGDVEINTELGRLRPEYLSVRDFLGSAKSNTILVAIAPGEPALFAIPTAAVTTIQTPVVEQSGDGSSLTVRGTNGTGGTVEATLPTVGDSRVQLRGRVDDLRLYQIRVDGPPFSPSASTAGAAEASTQSLPIAPPATDSGEGASGDSAGLTSLVLGETQAEGESVAAHSVTLADIFVPPVRAVAAGTDGAMEQVASELSIHSEAADQLAEQSALETTLEAEAIDVAIADR